MKKTKIRAREEGIVRAKIHGGLHYLGWMVWVWVICNEYIR